MATSSRRRDRRILAVGAVLAIAILAAGLLVFVSQRSAGSGAPDTSRLQYLDVAKRAVAGLPEKDGVLGYADAPVTIVEFADLRCPVCRQFEAQVMPDVIDRLVRTHKAKVDLRLWAILGPNSVTAHRAGYAAQAQGALWPFALVTYYNQGDEQVDWFDDGFARAAAAALGLDLARFDRDRASGRFDAVMAKTEADAVAAGATGTPTIVVKGPNGSETLSGVPDLAALEAAVAKAGG
jgi:protein-disulfide isomerase